MTHAIWSQGSLIPGAATQPLIVDSYLLRDGFVVGLAAHELRFARSISGGVPNGFFAAVRAWLPKTGTWFPRIEWYGAANFGVILRPAPQLRSSTRLWFNGQCDPRRQPTLKGPDLGVLGQLRAQALAHQCDDALLVDAEGVILETANACLIFWADSYTIVLPTQPVLPSITLAETIPLWQAAGISVLYRDVYEFDLPAWCASSVHGWTPVEQWQLLNKEVAAAPGPPVEPWNRALWHQAEQL